MSDTPREPVEEEIDLGEIVDEQELGDEPQQEWGEGLEEGGDEPLEPDDTEPEPVAPARQGRKGEAQRYRDRALRAEERLSEILTRQPQAAPAPTFDPAAQARAEAEKWERRAMMSPVELAQDVQREMQANFQQAFVAQQVQTQDLIDKQAYDTEARTSSVHQKYQKRVETLLGSERARGNYGATRVAILKYLIGEDALERAGRAVPRQQRAASNRLDAQRTRPVGARGDVARGGRRPAAGSLEADIELVNAAIARGESVF